MSISSGPSSNPYPTAGGAPAFPESISAPNPHWKLAEKNGHAGDEEDEIAEEDEEIDQLASASEPDDDEPGSASTSGPGTGASGGSKRYSRNPGTTCLPATKIENILQADGGTGSLSLSKEGLHILSVATEEFIKRIVQGGHRQANSARRNAINYRDMGMACSPCAVAPNSSSITADTTRQYQEFMFLKDIIPYPMSLADAFDLREAVMNNPTFGEALSALPSRPTSGPTPNSAPPPKPRMTPQIPRENGGTQAYRTMLTQQSNAAASYNAYHYKWHLQPTPNSSGSHTREEGEAQRHETATDSAQADSIPNGVPSAPSSSSSSSTTAVATPRTDVVATMAPGPSNAFMATAEGAPSASIPGRTVYTQETPLS
ncbi:hypothetical protein D9757_003550 [Collybiopsis confluens]|uniref:Transcription factor CBF/NF-Y/archaeal histone domain-containing protein n=1 Tax=Collybiopsis confluens TaxID=2823264 RepID=A0A8H5MCV8_9AGAR|nr:hypothetical protein D9757_003550 [Collybiopsis confluens]